MNRRTFLRSAATALAAGALSRLPAQTAAAPRPQKTSPAGRKLRVAFVGVANRGFINLMGCVEAGAEVAALCDVNRPLADTAFNIFPDVPRYRDYRQMLDEMHDRIDAVVISTPDHMHYPIALLALGRGKHIYVEKPLTHTVAEARALRQAAARAGLVTQLGIQGHAGNGTRLAKEWVDAGVIGPVREVICWTQGRAFANSPYYPAEPIPETIEWNLWQGVAPEQAPYSGKLTDRMWRQFWLFGSAALGDMGSHIIDAPFWALDLRGDCKISATTSERDNIALSSPKSVHVTYEFPARGAKPPCKLSWYAGGFMPASWPSEFDTGTFDANGRPSSYGCLLLGDGGVIYMNDAYCTAPRLLPAERWAAFQKNRPPRTIPRVPKGDQYAEWIAACRGVGPAPGAGIADHSAQLTETVLLGNIATRTGRSLNYDATQSLFIGDPDATRLLGKTYRQF